MTHRIGDVSVLTIYILVNESVMVMILGMLDFPLECTSTLKVSSLFVVCLMSQ